MTCVNYYRSNQNMEHDYVDRLLKSLPSPTRFDTINMKLCTNKTPVITHQTSIDKFTELDSTHLYCCVSFLLAISQLIYRSIPGLSLYNHKFTCRVNIINRKMLFLQVRDLRRGKVQDCISRQVPFDFCGKKSISSSEY